MFSHLYCGVIRRDKCFGLFVSSEISVSLFHLTELLFYCDHCQKPNSSISGHWQTSLLTIILILYIPLLKSRQSGIQMYLFKNMKQWWKLISSNKQMLQQWSNLWMAWIFLMNSGDEMESCIHAFINCC